MVAWTPLVKGYSPGSPRASSGSKPAPEASPACRRRAIGSSEVVAKASRRSGEAPSALARVVARQRSTGVARASPPPPGAFGGLPVPCLVRHPSVSWLMTTRRSPTSMLMPGAIPTRSMVPSLGARSSFCIFIASTTSSCWPATTASPGATATLTTLPGMMARISSGPLRPAAAPARVARSRSAARRSGWTSTSNRNPSTRISRASVRSRAGPAWADDDRDALPVETQDRAPAGHPDQLGVASGPVDLGVSLRRDTRVVRRRGRRASAAPRRSWTWRRGGRGQPRRARALRSSAAARLRPAGDRRSPSRRDAPRQPRSSRPPVRPGVPRRLPPAGADLGTTVAGRMVAARISLTASSPSAAAAAVASAIAASPADSSARSTADARAASPSQCSSTQPVESAPARNDSLRATARWNGSVVWMPPISVSPSARPSRSIAASRSPAWTISFAMRLS